MVVSGRDIRWEKFFFVKWICTLPIPGFHTGIPSMYLDFPPTYLVGTYRTHPPPPEPRNLTLRPIPCGGYGQSSTATAARNPPSSDEKCPIIPARGSQCPQVVHRRSTHTVTHTHIAYGGGRAPCAQATEEGPSSCLEGELPGETREAVSSSRRSGDVRDWLHKYDREGL